MPCWPRPATPFPLHTLLRKHVWVPQALHQLHLAALGAPVHAPGLVQRLPLAVAVRVAQRGGQHLALVLQAAACAAAWARMHRWSMSYLPTRQMEMTNESCTSLRASQLHRSTQQHLYMHAWLIRCSSSSTCSALRALSSSLLLPMKLELARICA